MLRQHFIWSCLVTMAIMQCLYPHTTGTSPTPTTASVGEPESELVGEPESEPVGEAASEPTASSELTGNTDSEPGSSSEPTATEILVPSLSGMLIFIGGVGFAIGITEQRKRRRKALHKRTMWANDNVSFIQDGTRMQSKPGFLTDADIEAIEGMQDMVNRPIKLFKLVLPTLIALMFAPALLFLYNPLRNIFWPDRDDAPEINKAIASFLAPSGFVYAISFGFSLQGALQKQITIEKTVTSEVSFLEQIMILVDQMTLITTEHKMEVFKIVKSEAISIMLQVQDRQMYSVKDFTSKTAPGQVWKIVKLLRVCDGHKDWTIDRAIVPKLIDHMMKVNTASLGRHNLMEEKMHPVRWIFLEMLSFTAFFGVMLIKAQSYRLELTFCIMTVFSISALCYIVADLDAPYSGFFRVNLTGLVDVVTKAEHMYNMEGEKDSLDKTSSNVNTRHPSNVNNKTVMQTLTVNHPFSVET